MTREKDPLDNPITLGSLIARLEAEDPTLLVPSGFAAPHSYRGYYEQLAFEPHSNITVGRMLAAARRALNATFEGYKGGDFTMWEGTTCWVAFWGDCTDDALTMRELDQILSEARTPKSTTSEPVDGARLDRIRQYAVEMVAAGAESHAEDDTDEDGRFAERDDHQQAVELAIDLARAIGQNPAAALALLNSKEN